MKRTTGWRPIVSAHGPDENMSRLMFQDRVRKVEKEHQHGWFEMQHDGEVFLDDEMATRCRSSVGSLRYPSEKEQMGPTVRDKKPSRRQSKPTNHVWNQLKSVGRDMLSYPSWSWKCGCQDVPRNLRVVLDSDWAGDHTTRKSPRH